MLGPIIACGGAANDRGITTNVTTYFGVHLPLCSRHQQEADSDRQRKLRQEAAPMPTRRREHISAERFGYSRDGLIQNSGKTSVRLTMIYPTSLRTYSVVFFALLICTIA